MPLDRRRLIIMVLQLSLLNWRSLPTLKWRYKSVDDVASFWLLTTLVAHEYWKSIKVCLYVCVFVRLCLCLYDRLYVHVSVYLSVYRSACLSACLHACLKVQ